MPISSSFWPSFEVRLPWYSTQGSSTNSVVLGFVDTFGIKPELVSTGGIPGTYTQVMSGQIDVGWSAAPYLLDAAEEGKIRIIASGNDVPSMREQTVRVNVAHAAILDSRKPVLQRFTAGYRETAQWMYESPDAAKAYAEFAGVPERFVKRLREEYFPNGVIWSDRITGVDSLMADAVRFKFIQAPLSKEQIAQLIQIP
jgi:NitT/TauT family transport system substrate-binding protein